MFRKNLTGAGISHLLSLLIAATLFAEGNTHAAEKKSHTKPPFAVFSS